MILCYLAVGVVLSALLGLVNLQLARRGQWKAQQLLAESTPRLLGRHTIIVLMWPVALVMFVLQVGKVARGAK